MEPITVRGRYFLQGQDRFIIKGVVYQRHRSNRNLSGDPKDPLCEENLETVRRSLPLLEELGINTLFIYSINPAKNHDAAMRMLAEAGIYVIVCQGWLQRTPAELQESFYNMRYLHRMFAVVECMTAYPNTLGLALTKLMLVRRQTPLSESAPLMRAVACDVKRYMAIASEVRGQRILPLGFCTEKGGQTIDEFNYLTEGSPEERVDFFAFDNYSWVGESSTATLGYDQMIEQFAEARVPVFLSEYGGREGNQARPFGEAQALHGPAMTPVFSGGCAYEFFEAANHYGLVRGGSDGALRPTEDFPILRARLRAAPSPVTIAGWAEPPPPPTPPPPPGTWDAVPVCPLDWGEVRARVEGSASFLDD